MAENRIAKLHIASDHAGFALKKWLCAELAKRNCELLDHGTDSECRCDYPEYAEKLCRGVITDHNPGILICGTGIGMSMCANRYASIRAALCTTELHARMGRRHNDANVLCLGARITGAELALAIVEAFLGTAFEMGRHMDRIGRFSDSGVILPQK